MRDNDGRKLDHTTLEAIRIRAVDQIKQGAHPEEVAKVLGMSRSAVYRWVAKDAAGGREALLAQPVQQPSHRPHRQVHTELTMDDVPHKLAGPQPEIERRLVRIRPHHDLEHSLGLFLIQPGRPARHRFGQQGFPAPGRVFRHPPVHR